MKQERIVKKVTTHTSGTGGACGRVYLPKDFMGKIVLIKVLGKYDIEKWKRQKKKEELKKKERDEKLKKHLKKLWGIRKTQKV